MSFSELRRLLKLLRQHGVTRYRDSVTNLTIDLADGAQTQRATTKPTSSADVKPAQSPAPITTVDSDLSDPFADLDSIDPLGQIAAHYQHVKASLEKTS